jgi:hypothetical protein
MMVELKRISTALGLLAALASSALAQGSAPNANQLTADAVAGTTLSSNLAGNRIEIQAKEGVVTLTGVLVGPVLKSEELARTRHVAGVRQVVDQLQVANDGSVRTVQYPAQSAGGFPQDLAGHPIGGDVVYGGGMGTGAQFGGGILGTTSRSPFRRPDDVRPGSAMAGRCQRGRLEPLWTRLAQPGIPTTPGQLMLLIPTSRRSSYRLRTPGRPWPNIGPFYSLSSPARLARPSLFVGTTASGGWISRSTTPAVLHPLSVWAVRLLSGIRLIPRSA